MCSFFISVCVDLDIFYLEIVSLEAINAHSICSMVDNDVSNGYIILSADFYCEVIFFTVCRCWISENNHIFDDLARLPHGDGATLFHIVAVHFLKEFLIEREGGNCLAKECKREDSEHFLGLFIVFKLVIPDKKFAF